MSDSNFCGFFKFSAINILTKKNFFFFFGKSATEGERKMDLNFHSINTGFNLITDPVIRQMCEPNIINHDSRSIEFF